MWSSGFIAAGLGTPVASTPTLMAWRFLFAAGLLLAVVLLLRRSWPGSGEVVVQGLIGLLAQGVYLIGVVGAIEFGVSAGTTALVAALQPLLAASLAGPILGESVRARQWLGLTVGLAGVALVVAEAVRGVPGTAGAPLWAYSMPFIGMSGLVAATLLERWSSSKARLEALPGAYSETTLDVALAIQCATSALFFSMLAFFWGGIEPTGGTRFWAAVSWWVVFSTFGGYGFYWLNLKFSSVTRVSSLVYLTPPTTMVWAYLMFGEGISSHAVVGLVVCFGGVLMASRGA
ncbi:MAG: hypothetical protein AVDCRST_MAG25-1930 [uncultured Rubrobacteraceae bacterium]|uniref:EamA domain-containing protein n=1 Tax=uncultured Rubrobacteraceae bacterium TaxID=349277 RepID=A0A6J4RBK9_9ACTN|nr:MAG: hypothetical protein AVDCRST_MAG25-1930 [uncultured Rubrobacteraceae bacterium]